MEQPKVEDLIKVLEDQEIDSYIIIRTLSSILQQQMMYGGAIEDKLNYEIDKAKKAGYLKQ